MNKNDEKNDEIESPIQENANDHDLDSIEHGEDLLKSKLEEAFEKQEHLQGKYLRAVADLENARKRAIREREDAANRIKTQIISDLLPVMDAFKLGLLEAEKSENGMQVVEGFNLVISQFKSILGDYGLLSIDPVGKPFDPKEHDAIGYEETELDEAGIVVKTVRCGYTLKNKLVRAATVVLSKAKT